jgi:hypothetical protein
LGGRADEYAGVAGVLLAGEGVEAVAAGGGLGRVVVEEDDQVPEDVQRLGGPPRRLLFGADLGGARRSGRCARPCRSGPGRRGRAGRTGGRRPVV